MRVVRVLRCVDGDLIEDSPLPGKTEFYIGDVVSVLTRLRTTDADPGPAWHFEIKLGEGYKSQCVRMRFDTFLTATEYAESWVSPVSFAQVEAARGSLGHSKNLPDKHPGWLWFFRDGIYVTDRVPHASEIEHVILQVKSSHFQRDESFRRLREQVANFEAVENNLRRGAIRRPLPDDVKLLVWSRDGGACVRCAAKSSLHFDHIISLARGGSDEAENVQLLCRTCNLAKGDRIV